MQGRARDSPHKGHVKGEGEWQAQQKPPPSATVGPREGPRTPGLFYGKRPLRGLAETGPKESGGIPGNTRPEQVGRHPLRRTPRDMHHLPDNSVHLMITLARRNKRRQGLRRRTSPYRSTGTCFRRCFRRTYRTLVQGGPGVRQHSEHRAGRLNIPLHVYIMGHRRVSAGSRCEVRSSGTRAPARARPCAWGSWRVGEQPGVARRPTNISWSFARDAYKRPGGPGKNSVGRGRVFWNTRRASGASQPRARERPITRPPFPVELPLRTD